MWLEDFRRGGSVMRGLQTPSNFFKETPMRLTQRQIQAAGGVLHREGGIYFPSVDQLNAAMSMSYMGGLGGDAFFAPMEVLIERSRQINAKGYTSAHDDMHQSGELSAAACSYVFAAAERLNPLSHGHAGFSADDPPLMMPMGWAFKPDTPRQMLVKAAALILAEIERLDRKAVSDDENERLAA